MLDKIRTDGSKKKAFTYLELIVSMSLIVIIVLLSTPFLVTLQRSGFTPYGEFKCYAKYDYDVYGNGDWKLFQNVRYNEDKYTKADEQVETCKFSRPSGNVKSYNVTLYGGGGSGSMPYLKTSILPLVCPYPSSDDYKYLKSVKLGQPGESGNTINKPNMSLISIFKDDVAQFNLCKNVQEIEASDLKDGLYMNNCVGKGAEPATVYGEDYQKRETAVAYISNIILRGLQDESGQELFEYLGINDTVQYQTDNKFSPEKFFSDINVILNNLVPNATTQFTGKSGGFSVIVGDDGELIYANGGNYGISNNEEVQFSNILTEFIDKLISGFLSFWVGGPTQQQADDSDYLISPEDLSDAVEVQTMDKGKEKYVLKNENKYETDANKNYLSTNFGKGGIQGVLACKKNSHTYWTSGFTCPKVTTEGGEYTGDIEIKAGYCSSLPSGRGAGGAIVIQW